MSRLLALLGAVAMVVGAIALRSGPLSDDDGDAPPGAGATATPDVLRLHCATELAAACTLLAAGDDRIERTDGSPGRSADALLGRDAALGGGDVPVDVWLAPLPWVQLVGELGGPGGPLRDPSEVLARSPLVLAALDGRVGSCGEAPDWRCIGDAAPGLRPGVPPLDGTEGLFTMAQAGTAFFGRPDYATNDLESPPEDGGEPFADWASAVRRDVPRSPFASPLADMLATGTATYDFAASIEAVAVPAIAGTRQEGRLRLIYPSPMATVDVVAVATTGGDEGAASALLDLLTGAEGARALAGSGWRVPGQPAAAGIDGELVLPADDGLPAAGVLAALRGRLP